MIFDVNEEINSIYFIKKGSIKVFDRNYNPLIELFEGCFFGEYQILFDLLSGLYYRSSDNQRTGSELVLLTIDKDTFLNTITQKGNSRSFKHYFEIAIKKYKNLLRLKE